MADDFVLNFDSAPLTAGSAPVARVNRQKGGRWTDRAKEKRSQKVQAKRAVNGGRAGAPRTADGAGDGAGAGAGGAAKGKAKVPGTRTREGGAPGGGGGGGGGGGRPRLEQAVGPTGKKQFISSLFTADGLPVPSTSSSSSAPAVPARPSNAPLTSSTPADVDQEDGEDEDDAQPDPAPELTKLGLMPELVSALAGKLGITGPTACQAGAVPRLISPSSRKGKATKGPSPAAPFAHDAILRAQTGSGKTLTFLLPMLQDLLTLPASLLTSTSSTPSAPATAQPDRTIGTLTLILAPTRELASQIHTVLSSLLDSMPYSSKYSISPRALTAGLLVGGANRTHEKRRLRKGCPIVVATPGRLLDHLRTTEAFRLAGEGPKVKSQAPRGRDNANNAPLGQRGGGAAKDKLGLRWLIVDECDRLMDLGFEEQMKGILEELEKRSPTPSFSSSASAQSSSTNSRRRTILCSATASEGVDRLAEIIAKGGKGPEIVGAREDIKVREPVRRDLTVAVAGEKGKKRSAEDDEDEEEDGETGEKETTSTHSISTALQLPSGFTPPSQLLHHYLVVPPKLRFVSLLALLRKLLVKPRSKSAGSKGTKILVFMSCTDAVDFWWKAFGGMKMGSAADEDKNGEEEADKEEKDAPLASHHPLLPSIPIYRLHGSLPLPTRLGSLGAFSGEYKIEEGKRKGQETQDAVLLCTSVAARGLDVKNVGCVVQVDAPTEGGITEYIHRVGRTARAGAQGSAYSFLLPSEVPYAALLEEGINSADKSAKGKTRLREVGVEEVLRDGYGGEGREYETRATDVQMGFERWANGSEENAALARKAFQAHIRAYATHPSAEKHIFNTKALHLGHLAKSFGMREAPGHASAGSGSKGGKGAKGRAAKKQRTDTGAGGGGGSGGEGGFETGWKKKQMGAENRMKKLMRGPGANASSEFQVADTGMLVALAKGK
ncbi:hypothetical protein JCM1841_004523 [Sporobolomyces salmonicolor]